MKRIVILISLLLVAGYVQAASVMLQWDYTQGTDTATQFKVYSQISTTCTSTWAVIAMVAVPTQTYTDSMLSAGLVYCYRITAVDAAGLESPPSNVVMFQVQETRPTAPSNLRGTVIP